MNAPTLHLGAHHSTNSTASTPKQSTPFALLARNSSTPAPHPRDYIRCDAGYESAMRVHSARVGLLNEIQRELEEIRDNICRQNSWPRSRPIFLNT
jgi:hypothetical protein